MGDEEQRQHLGLAGEEPPRPEVPGFQVLRWLGSGASASVWLVRENASGAEFALKVLSVSLADHDDGGFPPPKRRAALRAADAEGGKPAPWSAVVRAPEAQGSMAAADRELALLSGERHDHLLQIYRQVETDRGPGLLQEYAAGGSLAELIGARGPVRVGEAVTILTPLAHALDYLHGTGTVHGDVSPGNVLFTAVGKPLLADLGVARALGSERPPSAGTPGFRAPDMGPVDRLDLEADIYALAALGWFALTGRVPAATAQRPPLGALVPDVPDGLVALLEEGLAERGRKRPSAAEFARRVFRAAAAEPLDLTASAHPSVASQLLTRPVSAGKPSARQGRALPFPARRGRGRSQVRAPAWDAGRSALWFRRGASGRDQPQHAALLTVRGRWGKALLAAAAVAAAGGATFATAGHLTSTGPERTEAAQGPHHQQREQSAAAAQHEAGQPAPPEARTMPAELEEALLGEDPAAAVPALAWLRTEALRTRSPALLERVNSPDTAVMEADRDVILSLVESGSWLEGFETAVQEVHAHRAGESIQQLVTATVTTSPFRQLAADGRVVKDQADAIVQRIQLELVREDTGWLIRAVYETPPQR